MLTWFINKSYCFNRSVTVPKHLWWSLLEEKKVAVFLVTEAHRIVAIKTVLEKLKPWGLRFVIKRTLYTRKKTCTQISYFIVLMFSRWLIWKKTFWFYFLISSNNLNVPSLLFFNSLKGQLCSSLSNRLAFCNEESLMTENNKEAAEERLQRIKKEIDNKKLGIKSLNLAIERLDITE